MTDPNLTAMNQAFAALAPHAPWVPTPTAAPLVCGHCGTQLNLEDDDTSDLCAAHRYPEDDWRADR